MRQSFLLRLIHLTVLLGCFGFFSFAQTPKTGRIIGTVLISEGRPAEGATVILQRVVDSVIVKTMITDKAGAYELNGLAIGKYFISVSMVGFQTSRSGMLEIGSSAPAIVNKAITLAPATGKLADVTVAATVQRPFIENKIDRMVVNVDASPTNTGLSAMEILEKSPGITIDADDNISLKGKQGVMILIDGKPSYLNGKDLASYLKNLPANQLDQVEIMTQPPAKYDASGNSGVINIRTKKNKANGFNGNVTSTAIFAKYFKNTNSLNFNLRKNAWNVFGNFGYSHWDGFGDGANYRAFRTDQFTPYNRYTEQDTYGRYFGRPYDFKLGTDYNATKNTTIGVVVSGSADNDTNTSFGTSNIYDSLHKFVQYNNYTSSTTTPWNHTGINLNLRQVIDKKGGEITADLDYVVYDTRGQQVSDNYLYNADKTLAEKPYLLNGSLPAKIHIYSFKTDMTKEISKQVKLEAGVKTSYVTTDNDAQYTTLDAATNTWSADTTRSNHFIYKENINAAYLSVNAGIKKLSIQAGLRAEQTIADGNQVVKNITFHRNYFQVFPTLYLSYAKDDDNNFGLSFGRRIQRPGYRDLNPFQYLQDRYNYQQGNPYLQPQFSNNIELSYNYKGQLNITANYSLTTDILNDVVKTVKDGDNYATYGTIDNVARNVNIGISANYTRKFTKWWNTNIYASVYNNHYKGIVNLQEVDASYTAYSFNMSNQFTFGNGWTGEVSGFYNSKNLFSSVTVGDAMGFFSLGGGKQVLKGKGSVRINIRDPFYLMHFHGITQMNTFYAEDASHWDNRRFIITLAYKFGKPLQQTKQRNRGGSNDEQDRVKTGGGNN